MPHAEVKALIIPPMPPPPTLRVPHAPFLIEEPWALPPNCARMALRRSTDGAAPRLATTVAVFADDECLNVVFQVEDDGIVATHFTHDAPLYEEDVVEIFVSPSDPSRYFEIEVSPLGTTFDARIESQSGQFENTQSGPYMDTFRT